jgi:hypothetical protein
MFQSSILYAGGDVVGLSEYKLCEIHMSSKTYLYQTLINTYGVIELSNVYKVLKTDSDFLTVALAQSQVDIIERHGDLAGCTIGCGVPVRKWSPVSVKIDGAYYMRNEFEFRMVLV